MSEIRYYKGKYKVKVVTKSKGYWIVEALQDFEDVVDGEAITVNTGETRIVPTNILHKQKDLPPVVKEHVYELKMEKKLKRMVSEEEKKEGGKKNARIQS